MDMIFFVVFMDNFVQLIVGMAFVLGLGTTILIVATIVKYVECDLFDDYNRYENTDKKELGYTRDYDIFRFLRRWAITIGALFMVNLTVATLAPSSKQLLLEK